MLEWNTFKASLLCPRYLKCRWELWKNRAEADKSDARFRASKWLTLALRHMPRDKWSGIPIGCMDQYGWVDMRLVLLAPGVKARPASRSKPCFSLFLRIRSTDTNLPWYVSMENLVRPICTISNGTEFCLLYTSDAADE